MNRNASYLLASILCAGAPCFAGVIFVDADAAGAATGASWADAFPDLQAALAVAQPGDHFWIAAGTYRPAPPGGSVAATFLVPAGVQLYGGFAGGETTLAARAGLFEQTILSGDLEGDDPPGAAGDADNALHVVTTPDGSTGILLDGLTVAHGNASQPGATAGSGAGISVGGNLVLRHAILRDHRARKNGAALFARGNGAIALMDVELRDNAADQDGGALHLADGLLVVSGCRFLRNESDADGGAIAVEQAIAMRDTLFHDNRASGSGGAVHAFRAEVDMIACRFLGNAAGDLGEGGGATLAQCSGLVRNAILTGNQAGRGGGLACVGEPMVGDLTPIVLESALFYGNRATGGFGGGGIYGAQFGLAARNSILWANEAPAVATVFAQFSGVGGVADYCCIEGFDASAPLGIGNMAVEPELIDPDGADGVLGTPDDDVRLAPGSPCIDRGSNFGAHGLDLDAAGLPRIVDDPQTPDGPGGAPPLIDLGPHEHHTLVGSQTQVSVASGGFAYQEVAAGPAHGGSLYLVLGSGGGTHPGLTIAGQTLTLNLDPYFNLTLKEPNKPPLSQSFGTLSGAGQATAVFTLPAGLDPVLVGLELNHAAVVLTASGVPTFTTTAYPLYLVP